MKTTPIPTVPSYNLTIREPISALTHFLFDIMIAFLAIPLMMRAAETGSMLTMVSMGIFVLGMFCLYTASTVYHTFDISYRVNTVLKKFDHSMIFILIAATYTPVCLLGLKGRTGTILLTAVWIVAALGIIMKMFFVYAPRWISSVLYISMGWLCIFAMKPLITSLSLGGFLWLLGGGLLYTAGGVIYSLKLPGLVSRHKNFGGHELFHLFCIGGSICHFVLMFQYLVYR